MGVARIFLIIIATGYHLTLRRYVGAEEVEDDGILFGEKMADLSATLYELFPHSERLNEVIASNYYSLEFQM